MLSDRRSLILKNIIARYVERAMPVPSQDLVDEADLRVSPATIRNEMAVLEQEGYIVRPHTSAGSVPTDKGYRHYVDSLEYTTLSGAEQRLVSHLFHQVEQETERWLSLAASLLAQLTQNAAVVTKPKSADGKLKHVELLSLSENLVLLVVLLFGAKVRQKIVSAVPAVSQEKLTTVSNKLNACYSGLTRSQIEAKKLKLAPFERQVYDFIIEMMRAEDELEYENPYLDGLHFTLNQPEFARSEHLRSLLELVEYRNLLATIIPAGMSRDMVHVVIGKENQSAAIQNCSVVISQYGSLNEAVGAIGVIGPTRMSYLHTIATVNYLASVLSGLVAGLYGEGKALAENS